MSLVLLYRCRLEEMVISNKKLSAEKINETQIIKLLSSDNIEQENKDNLLTRILKIEEKFG